MTGFNLPPGVEVHHIPGNTPEDLEADEFYDLIAKNLEVSIGEARATHFFDYIEKGDWEEVLQECLRIANDLGMEKGLHEAGNS